MPTFIVQGGRPLNGRIRPAGNKNAALPALAATLLAHEPVTLENMPRIEDVETQLELLQSLGATVEWIGSSTVRVDTTPVQSSDVNPELAKRIRASILLAGPLLARFGRASMPPPGGDVIGRRRLDTHFLAFSRLGAEVHEGASFELVAPRLRGRDIFLDEPSVTATENAIMAAVLAEGRTRLRNVAQEPHVQDLCHLLNAMGAQIGGVGQGTLDVTGVGTLQGACFRVGADHIETGSFIGLAAVTGGEIIVEQAPLEHLDSTLLAFARLGIECRTQGSDLLIPAAQTREIRTESSGYVSRIDDGPWPAFPADLTSIALVTATQCRGTILIHEKMFESRMFFTDKLLAMGAQVILCDPHRAVVVGPSRLRGGVVESPDIRAGMALLIATLGAEGQSRIHNIGQIERGYERIDERLRGLGARIERAD